MDSISTYNADRHRRILDQTRSWNDIGLGIYTSDSTHSDSHFCEENHKEITNLLDKQIIERNSKKIPHSVFLLDPIIPNDPNEALQFLQKVCVSIPVFRIAYPVDAYLFLSKVFKGVQPFLDKKCTYQSAGISLTGSTERTHSFKNLPPYIELVSELLAAATKSDDIIDPTIVDGFIDIAKNHLRPDVPNLKNPEPSKEEYLRYRATLPKLFVNLTYYLFSIGDSVSADSKFNEGLEVTSRYASAQFRFDLILARLYDSLAGNENTKTIEIDFGRLKEVKEKCVGIFLTDGKGKNPEKAHSLEAHYKIIELFRDTLSLYREIENNKEIPLLSVALLDKRRHDIMQGFDNKIFDNDDLIGLAHIDACLYRLYIYVTARDFDTLSPELKEISMRSRGAFAKGGLRVYDHLSSVNARVFINPLIYILEGKVNSYFQRKNNESPKKDQVSDAQKTEKERKERGVIENIILQIYRISVGYGMTDTKTREERFMKMPYFYIFMKLCIRCYNGEGLTNRTTPEGFLVFLGKKARANEGRSDQEIKSLQGGITSIQWSFDKSPSVVLYNNNVSEGAYSQILPSKSSEGTDGRFHIKSLETLKPEIQERLTELCENLRHEHNIKARQRKIQDASAILSDTVKQVS